MIKQEEGASMNMQEELWGVPVVQLEKHLTEKKNNLQECHDRLLKEIEFTRKKIKEYETLERQTVGIQKYVSYSLNVLNLLGRVSNGLKNVETMISKIENLTIDELTSGISIKEWICNHDNALYKISQQSTLLQQYRNRNAINSIEIYDATLKAVYEKRDSSDVFAEAIKYLKSNGVVDDGFKIKDLVEDFIDYSKKLELESSTEMKKNILQKEEYWKILREYYYRQKDNVFLRSSLSEIKGRLIREKVVAHKYTISELKEDLRKIREN